MIETEAKIKLSKKEFKYFKKLFNPNFFEQENTLYEIPKGFIRIRKEKGKILLTLKKSSKGEFNSRTEIEFETNSSIQELKLFLSLANFRESLSYKKIRANINKNNCVISLDIIKNNYYIEIEGCPKDIKQTIKNLKLKNHKLETKSYLEIIKGTSSSHH